MTVSVIDYQSDFNVLLSVKGHPYERDAFLEIFEQMDQVAYSTVEQPLTEHLLPLDIANQFDCLVFYDMPGIDFKQRPPAFIEPSPAYKANFLNLLKAGKGMVFLHHAIAAWPTWHEYSEIVGGRFLYRPGSLRGVAVDDSGYKHQASYNARVLVDHPVTEGVPKQFPLVDELYLYEVLDDTIEPILQSDFTFTADHFNSALAAVSDSEASPSWHAVPGSPLIGWVKSYGSSPIVYLQMGDGPEVYSNSHYRQLLGNAIRWVASDEAKAWAKARTPAKARAGGQTSNPR